MVGYINVLTWDKKLTHNVNVNRFGAISWFTFCQNCIVSRLSEFKSTGPPSKDVDELFNQASMGGVPSSMNQV